MAIPSCYKYDYDDEWIINNYPGRCTTEFFNAYKERTAYPGNKECLRKHIQKMHIRTSPWKDFTQDMDEWLLANYSKLGRLNAIRQFQEKFNTAYSDAMIGLRATKHLGIRVDRMVAYNNRHSLRESEKILYEEGTIRGEDAYKVIKVRGQFIPLRKYLYEQQYGKVPDGYSVTYLDDPCDYSLENTVCVPKNYILLLTSHKLRAENKTITRCGIKWCELYYTAVEKGLIKPRKS